MKNKSNKSFKTDTSITLSLNDIKDAVDGNDYYNQIQKDITTFELLLKKGLNKTNQNQSKKKDGELLKVKNLI